MQILENSSLLQKECSSWNSRTKEAQSVWTFCLFTCPVFLLTLNSSLRVVVMCVTARSAACLWSWRRLPGPCWHHWYTPTDRPSTPSTASPAEEPHTDEVSASSFTARNAFAADVPLKRKILGYQRAQRRSSGPCCLLQKRPICFQWSTSWRAKRRRWTCAEVWPSRCFLPGRRTSRWKRVRPTTREDRDWLQLSLWLHLVVQISKFTQWLTPNYYNVTCTSHFRPINSDLGAAGDGAGGETNRRSPADVSHPITVSLQLLILLPLAVFLSGNRKWPLVKTWTINHLCQILLYLPDTQTRCDSWRVRYSFSIMDAFKLMF